MEPCERFLEVVVGDALVFDVETVEECLVEQAALFVIAAAVELLRVLQQLQTGVDQPRAVGEVFVRLAEALCQMPTLPLDISKPRLDLGLRERAIGGEVDEVLLAGVQPLKLGGELFVEESGGRFLGVDGLRDVRPDVRDEAGAEAEAGVVSLDRLLEADHIDVRGVAGAILLAAAEHVHVQVAVAVGCVLEDQSLGDAIPFAAPAPPGLDQVP